MLDPNCLAVKLIKIFFAISERLLTAGYAQNGLLFF